MGLDDFDGTLPASCSLTVTTEGGTGTAVPFQGIEDITPPAREVKEDVWTPISGTRTNEEQILLCSKVSGTITLKVTYEASRSCDMDAIVGVNGSSVVLVIPGVTYTGTGGVKKVAEDQLTDSKHITSTIDVRLAAGYTKEVTATTVIRVPAYTFSMVGGGPTSIDLTACGAAGTVNLTGYMVTKLTVTALVANGNAITIAVGASNGYAITPTFSQILGAGESATFDPLDAPTVASDAKTLDVSGTSTQGLTVYIEAELV